jgi:ABC-type hemin transport system substrate-binding protein
VSLAPALTQLIVELGAADELVGVAEYDTLAPRGLPVVGNFLDVNGEALITARPTLVITMTGKGGVPARLSELSKAASFEVVSVASPESVREIDTALRVVARALQREPRGEELSERLHQQIAAIKRVTAEQPRLRVLLVIGTGPLMASGPGTVLDELLSLAGGINAASASPVRAPTFDREGLLAARPDVIVMLTPGAAPLGTIDTDARLAELRGLDIPATKNGRVLQISDPLTHVPGTNVVRTTALLAKALHPTLAVQFDEALSETEVHSKVENAVSESPAATEPFNR